MQLLHDVFTNYADMKKMQDGKTCSADKTTHSSIKSIKQGLPEFFRKIIENHNRENDFKITGSFGQGVISEIPWVCIFNRNITLTAQKGYYIVLLFSSDMSSCSLSLNQAVTEYREKYKTKVALARMSETAEIAKEFIVPISGTMLGPIKLRAKNDLGKGYERGAIQSFTYDKNNLPLEKKLVSDFLSLIKNYDALYTFSGNSLSSLSSISEGLYQEHALKLASDSSFSLNEIYSVPGGISIPPKRIVAGRETYTRDDRIAAKAISNASFRCELDPNHITFISNSNRENYVEAHHLIPMGKQVLFDFSLDVIENIIALCPTCHRLLHHGTHVDKIELLGKLLSERKNKLLEREISIDIDSLCNFYSSVEVLLADT